MTTHISNAVPKYQSTRRRLNTAALAVAMLGLAAVTSVHAGQRPISDFLQQQVPDPPDSGVFPFLHSIWIDPKPWTAISFDFSGIDNAYWHLGLPTTMDGTIDERPLADGTAEVSIVLHTHNAAVFAFDLLTGSFPDFELLLGNYPWETTDSSQLAVGDCTLQLEFINPGGPGAPLPWYEQLLYSPVPGQKVLFLAFAGQATGPMPDGSTGFAQTRQTALMATSQIANPNSRVALDAFPAEKIVIQPVGK